jgi:protein-ribulosamine 3-kinase
MPQINTQTDDWCEFWRAQRLGYQLERAAAAGYGGTLQRKSQRLLTSFDKLFSDYNPQPALLHGNLWSGNYAMDRNGQAIIFDPTVYYGDREADLTMTELFGGFAHVLNHLNLFGDTYVRRAEQMMDFVLGELGKLPQYPE